jgi:tetratricopeptide (TPR) repeat protein
VIGGAAVVAARGLGYRPLLARALLLEGHAGMNLDDRAAAAPALAEATSVAIAVGDDALAVEAWARRAWALAMGGGDPVVAMSGLEVVDALAERRSTTSFARALLDNNVGAVAFSRGRREEALARYERALAWASGVVGPGAIELVNVRVNAASVIADPVRRDRRLAEAEAELARLVGADHPETLALRTQRAMLLPELGPARALLASTCAGYDRLRNALSAGAAIECWEELGFIADELGARDDAVAAMARAVRWAAGEPGTVLAESDGYVALWRGDARAARERFGRQLASVARTANEPPWTTYERGKLALGLGRALLAAGDATAGRAALEQAIVDLGDFRRVQPAAMVDRRLTRARAELVGALRATRGAERQIAEMAGAAAEGLRAEGGRADEIAALERAAGER